jgi:hypothetical protein
MAYQNKQFGAIPTVAKDSLSRLYKTFQKEFKYMIPMEGKVILDFC